MLTEISIKHTFYMILYLYFLLFNTISSVQHSLYNSGETFLSIAQPVHSIAELRAAASLGGDSMVGLQANCAPREHEAGWRMDTSSPFLWKMCVNRTSCASEGNVQMCRVWAMYAATNKYSWSDDAPLVCFVYTIFSTVLSQQKTVWSARRSGCPGRNDVMEEACPTVQNVSPSDRNRKTP